MKTGNACSVAGFFALLAGCGGSSIGIEPLEDQRASVGRTLVFDVCVKGAEGKVVTFSFDAPDVPSSGAQLSPMGMCANFRWTPRPEHAGIHPFTFRASAGGASDSESIEIEVVASSSAPVFIQPGAGGTYDLSREPCVDVHVEVKDDDTLPQNIVIEEGQPKIEGGQLTQSGKTADWHWCPAQQQTEASDRYTLKLAARDESHDAVEHEFIIVLRGVGKENCPGAPPRIVANYPPPPFPPQAVASSMDFDVHATIEDDKGIKEMPILYYSFDPPEDPGKPDIAGFRQAIFESAGGREYTAYVPNPGLAEGARKTVYYIISVKDNDDEEGVLCDHRVDSALFQFDVTGGGGSLGAYCDRCSASGQCASGACVAAPQPFCAAACGACPAGGACRNATLVEGDVQMLCVPPDLDCGGAGTCTDDRYEENDTRTAAEPLLPDAYDGLTICPGDQDYYSFAVSAVSEMSVMIAGWNPATADIDLQLLDPSGTVIATSEGIADEELVETCLQEPGTYYVRVYGILGDTGPYEMVVLAEPSSCCLNDIHEPNDTYSAAKVIPGALTRMEGKVCPTDVDWFKINAPAGQRLSATLTITGGGDLDLELYDRDGTRRLDYSVGTTATEQVDADITTAGYYYLRVFGYRSQTGTYQLSASFGASSSCTTARTCAAGMICRGGSCADDACTPPGTGGCPAGYICPAPGGTGGQSDCADTCTSSTTCRSGYACKVFDEGMGCARAGSGLSGDDCGSFRDCAGTRACLAWPGGYCARLDCLSNADCPFDAFCVEVTGFTLGVCVQDCYEGDSLCRLAEGYRCSCAKDVSNAAQFVCLPPSVYGPACY